MQRTLLEASFEESTNLVTREVTGIDEEDSGVKTMKLSTKIFSLFIGTCFVGVFAYMIGIEMPDSLLHSKSEDIHLISVSSAHLIGKVGSYCKPLVFGVLILWEIFLLINLLPKKNYSTHYFFGSFGLGIMILLAVVPAFVLSLGLTVESFGWLGIAVITIVGINVMGIVMKDCRNNLMKKLYSENSGEKISNKKNKTSILLVLISLLVINKYTFRVGYISQGYSLISLFYGFSYLIFFIFLIISVNVLFPRFVKAYYFKKYGIEYKEYFKLTEEQWYGKRKARRLQKKRKNES